MYAGTTVIYADILFLINFSLDFLCLFIAGRLLNCAGKTWRLVIAADLGGVYSFLPYILETSAYISFLLHLAAAGVMTFTAFGKRDIKKFLILFGTFIVSSALLGGLITAIYSLSGNYSDGAYTEIDAVSFCAICVISAVIALSYGLICRKKIHIRSAEIRIYMRNEKFGFRLLCDSGNLVTEPFSALPVIIVSAVKLPPPYNDPESEVFPFPIRAIPYSTSAGSSCFFGFRPDRIEAVQLGKKAKRIDAYIGIDTANRSFSGYDGLMPTSLL